MMFELRFGRSRDFPGREFELKGIDGYTRKFGARQVLHSLTKRLFSEQFVCKTQSLIRTRLNSRFANAFRESCLSFYFWVVFSENYVNDVWYSLNSIRREMSFGLRGAMGTARFKIQR